MDKPALFHCEATSSVLNECCEVDRLRTVTTNPVYPINHLRVDVTKIASVSCCQLANFVVLPKAVLEQTLAQQSHQGC